MFFSFRNQDIGIDDEQWEEIPRGDRVIIRDFYLNGQDIDQTMLYGYYDTASQVRKAVNNYQLRHRPSLQIALAEFVFP